MMSVEAAKERSSWSPRLKLWHWVLAVAGFVFWTDAMTSWAREARHFGHELWIVFPVLFLVFTSPLFALASGALTVHRYRHGRIDHPTLCWRLGWALVMLMNFVAVLWIVGALK